MRLLVRVGGKGQQDGGENERMGTLAVRGGQVGSNRSMPMTYLFTDHSQILQDGMILNRC